MAFIAFHPIFCHPLPPGHRFPMLKYELLPQQLLREGIVVEADFFEPEMLNPIFLNKVHDAAYWEKLRNLNLDKKEIRRMGFPLNQQLIERELRIAQGTIQSAEAALKTGLGFNIAGGTHHAGSNWAEGFCLLNDQAIAAHYLLEKLHLNRILIIDLDVHQGNGTAEIFQNEKRVFTFSMHGENNFPFHKEKSDLDIGLKDGIEGVAYLNILHENLDILFSEFQPEFVFYQAGVDVLSSDKMGKMKLNHEDCKQRDYLVFKFCKQYQTPIQVSMGGGYSEKIKDIVNAHCNTFRVGIEILF